MANIYEVAEKAGVSPKTAARILSGSKGRGDNRKRVMAAAEAIGYVRNQQAANLRSGCSGLLGLVIPDINNPLYTRFFEIAHDIALQHNYQFTIAISFSKMEGELHALKMAETNRVDGLVINSSESVPNPECDSIIRRLHKRGTPIVLAGRSASDLPVDTTRIENRRSIIKAYQYLHKIGRRKIAFINGNIKDLAGMERYEGFIRGVEEFGNDYPLPNPNLYNGDFRMENGHKQMVDLLASGNKPDAVIAANDLLAIGAISACKEASINVPEDVAIVGFDDISISSLLKPSLTTLRQPQEIIAKESIQLLIERIQNKDLSNPKVFSYSADLIIRESA